MQKQTNTQRLVESGVLLAVATVLSFIKFVPLPQGGSVTLCSMLPLVLLGYKYGPKWGGFCGLTYGAIEILMGFAPPPAQGLLTLFLEIMLDYLLAWACVGFLSGIMGRTCKKMTTAIVLGAVFGIFGRYLCSVLSGVLIWGAYAPEGQSIWVYSIVYNGTWAFPEMGLTAVAGGVLSKFSSVQKLLVQSNRKVA